MGWDRLLVVVGGTMVFTVTAVLVAFLAGVILAPRVRAFVGRVFGPAPPR